MIKKITAHLVAHLVAQKTSNLMVGDAKFVYKITNAEYEDMNGYYYFDANNSSRNNLIYRNSETNAVIRITYEEVLIESDSGMISSGWLAGDGQMPTEHWDFYLNWEADEMSTLKMYRINKFYLSDGTYCKLIASQRNEEINGEYYCLEELKKLYGMEYDVYMNVHVDRWRLLWFNIFNVYGRIW